MAQRYRLTLDTLKFCSLVDEPAQPNAKVLAFKRNVFVGKDAGKEFDEAKVEATAKFVKASDELGLAFFWAFTSTNPDGSDHFDLQGDAISQDFMKAAMEWCLAGAPVDEMHDENATSAKTVFAFPMTPDIAKIYGITTKQSGLMIAIKPTDEQLAKLKKGEYTGVSIGGSGIREAVKAAKNAARVAKGALYTDLVDGHQHKICVYQGDDGDDAHFSCEYATSEAASCAHSHGVVFENGQLTILADSGHTHQLAEGQPGLAMVPPDAIVIVAARAPSPTTNASAAKSQAPKWTRPDGVLSVDTMKTIVLTEAQHAHYSKLASADAEAFIAKSATERDAEVQKAKDSDPVIYKTADGIEIRKSAGDLAVMLAKRADESDKQVAKAMELANAEKALRETAELTKRADTALAVVKSDDGGHVELLRAVESIADAKKRDAAQKTLAVLALNTSLGKRAPGIGGTEPNAGGTDSDDAEVDLEKALVEFCAEKKITKNIWTEGLAAFVKTEKGAALKQALAESLEG